MINTILFDLDGTLLPMDFDAFMNVYFEALSQKFKERVHPQTLISAVLKATDIMVNTNNECTNEQSFMDAFTKIVGGTKEEWLSEFSTFYENEFEVVQTTSTISKEFIQAVEVLKTKGYKLVIATNPLFPLQANLQRIRFAGLNYQDFDHITSLEEYHHNKPYLSFYKELLQKIHKQPSECLMVGNDVEEDLVAKDLGISTFLIQNCMIHRKKRPIDADHIGIDIDFLEFVKTLPIVQR
jgi:HAD superfamily hydrolase (TIGR01549 family)